MQAHPYKTDPRLVPPVSLALAAGLVILTFEGLTQRGLLTLILLSPFLYLGADLLARKITVDSSGLTVSKLLRTIHLDWTDINSMDVIRTGGKLLIFLEAENDRPILISSTMSPFKELVERIMEKIPQEKITPAAREVLTDPGSITVPVIQAWLVCAVLTGIVIGKLLGYG